MRIAVRVYDRFSGYYAYNHNQTDLVVTLLGKDDNLVLTAVTAGGGTPVAKNVLMRDFRIGANLEYPQTSSDE